jgi:hypothetical protein
MERANLWSLRYCVTFPIGACCAVARLVEHLARDENNSTSTSLADALSSAVVGSAGKGIHNGS